jgi:predicted nucleic acid-binding protein
VILLDTNVISELMRLVPEPKVLAWADGLDPGAVAITAMNEAEILQGLARLQPGRLQQQLQQSWDALAAELFPGRIWPFTSDAAHWHAELLRRREVLARPMATADAVIAATALAHGVPLATRDINDFAEIGIGLELINPWDLACAAPQALHAGPSS